MKCGRGIRQHGLKHLKITRSDAAQYIENTSSRVNSRCDSSLNLYRDSLHETKPSQPMKKIKTVHLHSDFKFVSGTKRLEGEHFENTVIIITNKKDTYKGLYKETAIFLTPRDLKKCIKYCEDADLVVVYDLDLFKSRVILKLPKNIKIAWRFFGYELYGKREDLFLSEKTRSYFESAPKRINKLKKIFYNIKYGREPLNIFYQAVNRIDYMMALCTEEYDFLLKLWEDLPEFIQLCFGFTKRESLKLPETAIKIKNQKRLVVVGNNRLMFNNHLDVIDLIDKSAKKSQYEFAILFNYGVENSYSEAVRQITEGKEYFHLIEDFMSLEEFGVFYQRISALVLNGYRQMAVGNIFSALKTGTKIYLNEKNVFIDWMRNEGFYVYTMEDFEEDLKNDNLFLDKEKAQKNLDLYVRLPEKYWIEDFQNEVYDKMKEVNYARQ